MKYHVSFDIEFKTHNFPGKIIALEGNEASGKTTQSNLVVEALKKKGIKAIATKEPTGSVVGKLIREGILTGKVQVTPVAIQYLFVADRAIHQMELIDYLKKGYIIVTDRYFWSSVAYGISDMEKVEDYFLTAFSLLSFYNRFIKPDRTFYLDIDMKTALERIKKSSKHREIYDNEKMFPRIEKGYRYLLEKFPEEFTIVNAKKSVKEITKDIVLGIV